jgi:hypothetical protein
MYMNAPYASDLVLRMAASARAFWLLKYCQAFLLRIAR